MRTVRLGTLGLLLAALMTACGVKGDNAAIALYPVSGKVKLANGQAARGASIRLIAKGTAGGADGSGVLASDGTFTIKSLGDRDGMMPGVYKIVISPTTPGLNAADAAFGKANIPKKYWTEESTDLEATVKTEDNTFEWTLK